MTTSSAPVLVGPTAALGGGGATANRQHQQEAAATGELIPAVQHQHQHQHQQLQLHHYQAQFQQQAAAARRPNLATLSPDESAAAQASQASQLHGSMATSAAHQQQQRQQQRKRADERPPAAGAPGAVAAAAAAAAGQQQAPVLTVARKRGRRRQQTLAEQPNGLDRVFVWDIDGSLVRSDTIADSPGSLEPSVLASVNDKMAALAKRLKEITLAFCEQHLFLGELESSDQMHIDDVPSEETASAKKTTEELAAAIASADRAAIQAEKQASGASQKLNQPQQASCNITTSNSGALNGLAGSGSINTTSNSSSSNSSNSNQLSADLEPELDVKPNLAGADSNNNTNLAAACFYEEQTYLPQQQQQQESAAHLQLQLPMQVQLQEAPELQQEALYREHQLEQQTSEGQLSMASAYQYSAMHHQPDHHFHAQLHHHHQHHQHQHQQQHQLHSQQQQQHQYQQSHHFAASQPQANHIHQHQHHHQLAQLTPAHHHLHPLQMQHHHHQPQQQQHYEGVFAHQTFQPAIANSPGVGEEAPTISNGAYYANTQQQLPNQLACQQVRQASDERTNPPAAGYLFEGVGATGEQPASYYQQSSQTQHHHHQLHNEEQLGHQTLTYQQVHEPLDGYGPVYGVHADESFHQLNAASANQEPLYGPAETLWAGHSEQSQHHLSSHGHLHIAAATAAANYQASGHYPPMGQQADFQQTGHFLADIHQHHEQQVQHSHANQLQLAQHQMQQQQQPQLLQTVELQPAKTLVADLQHGQHLHGHQHQLLDDGQHQLHVQHSHQQPNQQQQQQQHEQPARAEQTTTSGGQPAATATTTLRTVLNNHHKQLTHRLSMRFNRIKSVYNSNRTTFKGQSSQSGGELVEILAEIDHYTLDWRKHAIDCLRLISDSPNCTNIIVTKLPLVIAFGHLVCLGLGQFFELDQVYSASKTNKESCIKRIKKRFGATNRCSYIIVGDKEDVEMAKRLDLPTWITSRSDGHRQLLQLYTALKEGYLM